MTPLRILLVDDHTLFRKGVRALLTHHPDFEVVGEAGDGFEAITVARETMPDVILMDIDMPQCNGLEATRVIHREMPHVRIVMLTVSVDDDNLFEAIKVGAQGYLVKDLEPHQLYDFLLATSRGEAPLSGIIAARILEEVRQMKAALPEKNTSSKADEATAELTSREIAVLGLIAQGMTNKEISSELVISENTVKNHVANIIDKLHLQNRIQAALYASRHGLTGDPSQDHPAGR